MCIINNKTKKSRIHRIPRIKDSISHLYLERCKIEADKNGIISITEEGKFPIPCGIIRLIMLGPGTSITHDAIRNIAESGCDIQVVGEHAVRMYAHAEPLTKSSKNILKQAILVANQDYRTLVAKNMYRYRFNEPVEPEDTIGILRGKEGVRIKSFYSYCAKIYGVDWKGRNYNAADWDSQDDINKALSSANVAFYGIVKAAICAMGYSSALGFIHTGHINSFVFDIADLYKTKITIPMAFEIVATKSGNIAALARTAIRDYIKQHDIMKTIVEDIHKTLDIRDIAKEHGVKISDQLLQSLYGIAINRNTQSGQEKRPYSYSKEEQYMGISKDGLVGSDNSKTHGQKNEMFKMGLQDRTKSILEEQDDEAFETEGKLNKLWGEDQSFISGGVNYSDGKGYKKLFNMDENIQNIVKGYENEKKNEMLKELQELDEDDRKDIEFEKMVDIYLGEIGDQYNENDKSKEDSSEEGNKQILSNSEYYFNEGMYTNFNDVKRKREERKKNAFRLRKKQVKKKNRKANEKIDTQNCPENTLNLNNYPNNFVLSGPIDMFDYNVNKVNDKRLECLDNKNQANFPSNNTLPNGSLQKINNNSDLFADIKDNPELISDNDKKPELSVHKEDECSNEDVMVDSSFDLNTKQNIGEKNKNKERRGGS